MTNEADALRRQVATLQERCARAEAGVAALLDAYIGITPGADVPGLHSDVRARAEAMLAVVQAAEAYNAAVLALDGIHDAERVLRAAVAALGASD